jgi:hypothetical protein
VDLASSSLVVIDVANKGMLTDRLWGLGATQAALLKFPRCCIRTKPTTTILVILSTIIMASLFDVTWFLHN